MVRHTDRGGLGAEKEDLARRVQDMLVVGHTTSRVQVGLTAVVDKDLRGEDMEHNGVQREK